MTNIHSDDRTVEASVSPLGVVLHILRHEWHWIISARDGALHLQGSVHPVPEGHDPAARTPESCAGCKEFIRAGFTLSDTVHGEPVQGEPAGRVERATTRTVSPRLMRLGRT